MKSSAKLLVYKASAGSGKTFTLAVEYMKQLILNPRNYRNILAVTFTNKATAEMKERILGQLYGIACSDPASDAYLNIIAEQLAMHPAAVKVAAKEALHELIHDYGRFRVETIDSFFQSIVRDLARELELGNSMNLELDSREALSQAVDIMIANLNRKSPVLHWLLDYIEERIQNDRKWNVAGEIKSFGSNIFDEAYIEKGQALRKKLRNPDTIVNYRRELQQMEQAALKEMKQLAEGFFTAVANAGLTPAELKSGERGICSYFRKIERGELLDKVRIATVEKSLVNPEEWVTKTSKRRKEIISLAESIFIPLLEECECKREKNNIIVNSCRLSLRHTNNIRLLTSIDEEVRKLNEELNRFLLADTNALLHNLVGEEDTSFVFEKTGSVIRTVMIDEFQDTSRMQWGNFRMLLSEGLSQGEDSLIVGDVKQSIYRWRGGDWRIFNDLEGKLGPHPIRIETLTTNRRSESRVIRFNNELFTAATKQLNQINLQDLGRECEDLSKAYADVCQHSPRKEEKGYVQVSFLDDAEDDISYSEATLQSMSEEVVNLIESGVQQRDIAILVRRNKSIPEIAHFFEQTLPYRIVSDEAFRLDASTAVNLIIDGMRLLFDPKDKIAKARLIIAWQNDVHKRKLSIDKLFGATQQAEHLLPQAYTSQVEGLRMLPLYELCEKLYTIFDLHLVENQDGYLFSFFDAVIEYVQSKPSDIQSFVHWWDESLSMRNIPGGEIEGIRILSIHKSKGLEYHTVLLPFCDWSMEVEKGKTQLVWCSPGEAPFNDLDLVPINYSTTMAQSIYCKDYEDERLQLWVDNLNLLYVALTRAGKNLYIWSRTDKKNSIASLLHQSISNMAIPEGARWDGECFFSWGELCPSEINREEKENSLKTASANRLTVPAQMHKVEMASFRHRVEFRQSNRSIRFIEGEEESAQEKKQAGYINRGQLLHALFSAIETSNDIDKAIGRLTTEGIIASAKEADQLGKLARFALSHPKVSRWFSGDYQLFNERAIIYKDQQGIVQTRIPDRVMMKEGQVVVVDFKFGKRQKEYTAQVSHYMRLLQQMGHKQVEGYIWYVFENSLEEVSLI